MNRKRRAQITTQFIMLLSFVFLTCIIFIAFIGSRYAELGDEKEYLFLKDTSLKIKAEIDLAVTVQDGYYREFLLVDDARYDYDIDMSDNYLTLSTEDNHYTLFVHDFEGELIKGVNRITKNDGVICINTAECG